MNERLSKAAQCQLGRFLSRDPIGHAGGLNLYEYAHSSPSTYVDPTGLDTATAIAKASTGIAAGTSAQAVGVAESFLVQSVKKVAYAGFGPEFFYHKADPAAMMSAIDKYFPDQSDAIGHFMTAWRLKRLADAQQTTTGCPGSGRNPWTEGNISRPPGLPTARDPFINWLRGIQRRIRDNRIYFNETMVNDIVGEATRYGLPMRFDQAHRPPNPWDHPHYNIWVPGRPRINIHVPVPPGYQP